MLEFFVGDSIEVVSLNDAGGFEGIESEVGAEISDEVSGLAGEGGGFFDEKTVHGERTSAQLSQRRGLDKCLGIEGGDCE